MTQVIAVIGGDARYLEMIRQLQTLRETTIILIGFDKLEQGFTGLKQVEWEEVDVKSLDSVILPITVTDLDGYINTVFSDQRIKLTKEWLQQLRKGTLVFTGITNDYLNDAMKSSNATLIPLLDRDDVAIYNS